MALSQTSQDILQNGFPLLKVFTEFLVLRVDNLCAEIRYGALKRPDQDILFVRFQR